MSTSRTKMKRAHRPQGTLTKGVLSRLCREAIRRERDRLLGRPVREKTNRTFDPYSHQYRSKWKAAAKLGIPDGQYLWGQVCLSEGRSDSGLNWLRAASSRGLVSASTELGDELISKGDVGAGLKLLRESVRKKDAWACQILAIRCGQGRGVPRSRRKYLKYLEMASVYGSCHAFRMLWEERAMFRIGSKKACSRKHKKSAAILE